MGVKTLLRNCSGVEKWHALKRAKYQEKAYQSCHNNGQGPANWQERARLLSCELKTRLINILDSNLLSTTILEDKTR